jgi:hypothetical protein
MGTSKLKSVTRYSIANLCVLVFPRAQNVSQSCLESRVVVLQIPEGTLCRKLRIPIGRRARFVTVGVSLLQQNSVPGDLIKKWIGHTSLRTTKQVQPFHSSVQEESRSKRIK